MMVLADQRWVGAHGIGRFAHETISRLKSPLVLREGPRVLSLSDAIWTSRQIRLHQPDVYFTPGFNPPLRSHVPVAFTIHDLIHLSRYNPRRSSALLYYNTLITRAIRRGDMVLTVSEFSRQEILEWASKVGLHDHDVFVLGNGVGREFQPSGPIYPTQHPYVLCVSNAKPHKNLSRALRAFRMSKLASECQFRLVCPHSDEPRVRRLVEGLHMREEVILMSGLSDDVLSSLYRGAVATVVPSVYEGYGLPAAEAGACDSRLALADIPALREQKLEGAVYFDPFDVLSVCDGLEKAAGSEKPTREPGRNWDEVAAALESTLTTRSGVRTR